MPEARRKMPQNRVPRLDSHYRGRKGCPSVATLPSYLLKPGNGDGVAGNRLNDKSLQKAVLTIVVITSTMTAVAGGIQAEIKQRRPFKSLEAEALLALLRTADQLQSRVAEVLKPHQLSPTQYNALRILRGAGRKGLPCSQIGERMINRDPDITRLLNRLESRGLVERGRENQDRRVITARATPAALELLKALDRPVEDFQRRLLGRLGERRLRMLIRLLDAARNAT
jgi:DNA-binding MarR family transcriptional regulator